MVLSKELTLYERDAEGELIPQEVPLSLSKKDAEDYPDLKGETIKIIPMPRGELKKMFDVGGKDSDEQPDTDKDSDAEIITKYCKEPLYTSEELTYAKPVIVRSIVRTIFQESGLKIDEDAGTKKINDKEDEFGKN